MTASEPEKMTPADLREEAAGISSGRIAFMTEDARARWLSRLTSRAVDLNDKDLAKTIAEIPTKRKLDS